MSLADDELSSQDRHILGVVKSGARTREQIAKELNVDGMSGKLQLELLALTARGWLRPESSGFTYWHLTDEGREELRRRQND